MKNEMFLPEVGPKERVQILNDTAYGVEEMDYAKRLTHEEVEALKSVEVQHSLKIRKLSAELKEIQKGFKDQIKMEQAAQNECLDQIQTGHKNVTEKVWLVDDQDSGMMKFYNRDGELVYQRPLMSNERQLRIKQNYQTAENQ